MDTGAQENALESSPLPQRTVEELADRKRRIEQRSLSGQPASLFLLAFACAVAAPVLLTALVLAWFYMHTNVAVLPREELRQIVWTVMAAGAAIFAIALSLAFWAGSYLSRAIGRLRAAGIRLQNNETVPPVLTHVREINELGAIFVDAAAEAERRQAHLRSILATVPSAMIVIDSRGIIQSFSKTAEKMFECNAADMIGANVSVLMPDPDRSAHDNYIGHYLETGEKRIMGLARTVTGQRASGARFPLELHVGEANVAGQRLFTGFMRDLTEKLRIEQELLQTQKMEAVGKLTGGVAHDFNNLLTVIKGNLEMLEPTIDAEFHDLVRDTQEAADLAAQLTASLLAFGRRMPLNPKLADAGQLVTATGDILRRTLGEMIEVHTSIRTGCRTIVDGPQLQNAILNLAINARDAMIGGGTLSIGVSEAELDQDYAAIYSEVTPGRYVMILISDTGSGMTDEVKARAFEPFFTTKPLGSGTGLGLSSVYGFVKQSGGHISLYSELGKGTTIRIYLPRATADGASDIALPANVADLPRGEGQLVLIAEDDDRVRRVTAARLRQLGYQVREASNGPAALEIVKTNPAIDLLFTDMVMPGGMTGAQLASAAQSARPDLQVLFTSGYAEPELLRETETNSDKWLRKPYSAAALAQTLSSIFRPAEPVA
jgi:PAS domain S-box-containing protein